MVSLGTLTILAALAAPPSDDTVLLEFTASWCAPCRMMEPALARLQREGYPVRQVDFDKQPRLVADYGVKGVPCFVMLANGREVDRVEGFTTYTRLERMFRVAENANTRPIATPSDHPPSAGSRGPQRWPDPPPMPRSPFPEGKSSPPAGDAPRGPAEPVPSERLEETEHRTGDLTPLERALAATVRITVEDAQHNSYGTGTIIDTHGKDALVLTCGHIFRESRDKGRVTVDLFGDDGHTSVSGRLFELDLDKDLALVIIRPDKAIAPIRVAPATRRVTVKERVITIGCSHGGAPSVDESYVSAVNRYIGAGNIEVAGQPVSGRSGGGLFNTDGQLIGVCNARDRHYNEGLYAALPEVQNLLTRVGLEQVFAERAPVIPEVDAPRSDPRMPILPDGRTDDPAPPDNSWERLTVAERRLLEMLRRSGDRAEFLFIVRPQNRPPELFTLRQPSPAFVDHLGREFVAQRQDARSTTGHWRPSDH
jgi:thiol-disulfide isomerase/thioredoxin